VRPSEPADAVARARGAGLRDDAARDGAPRLPTIVHFQLLTLAVAAARGIDPDPIRRTPGSRWAEAAGAPYPGA